MTKLKKKQLQNSHRNCPIINYFLSLILLIGVIVAILPMVNAWTSNLNEDLVAYWGLDEVSGNAIDLVNGRFNGTLYNSQQNVDGKINKSVNFTGANSHMFVTGGVNVTSAPLTYNIWIKQWNFSKEIYFLSANTTIPSGYGIYTSSNNLSFGRPGTDATKSSFRPNFTSDWQMITVVYNGTDVLFYSNGTLKDTKAYTTTFSTSTYRIGQNQDPNTGGGYIIDEVGFWNRTLSASEILTLWNNGNGLSYSPILFTLTSPADNSIYFPNQNIPFNCSVIASNIKNLSLIVNNVVNYTVYNTTTNQNNLSLFINRQFSTISDYNWSCSVRDSSNNQFNSSTYSFNINYWWENSQTFNNQTYETSSETFIINLTYDSSYYSAISANLIYNGTSYSGTKTGSGNDVLFSKTITIPTVTTSGTNLSFYWQIALLNASGINYYNSSFNNQTITKIYLYVCNATYTVKAFNFTVYNEQNLSRIRPFNFYATFTYGSQTNKTGTISINTPNINETTLCIFPADKSFYTDGIIEYNFEDANVTYTLRNYYFQNALINNQSQNISLYLLNAEDSTSFIIKAQDQKLSAVKEALVYIQRYYPQDGQYRTIQISKTDDNGETIGFYETETVDYKHIIIKDGIVLLETSPQKVVGKEVPFTLTFTTGEALVYPWSYWEDNPNIQLSLVYNDATKFVTFTYVDVTGATTFGRFLVFQESPNNYTIITICNSSSTQSSATFSCNMTGYTGSFIAKGIIETESNVVSLINFIITTAIEILDRTGLIMGWFIILTSGFAFLWNPTAGIVGINASLWFVSIIGLVSFSYIFLFAILGVSILAIILLKT